MSGRLLVAAALALAGQSSATVGQSTAVTQPKPSPDVMFVGSVDLKSGLVSLSAGQAKPRTYSSLQDALEGAGFSQSSADKTRKILAEAAGREFGSVFGQWTAEPEVTGTNASVVFRLADESKVEFIAFDRATPQDDKSCNKISENCIKCPDGTIVCNVPKPKG